MAEIEILESAIRAREYTEGEKAVLSYIQDGLSYEEVLRKDGSWEAFYHFAPMRQSLLNWYSFEENASLLELGCETGILTQFFCESCGQVIAVDNDEEFARAAYERNKHWVNLKVYAGDVRECLTVTQFDYVVLSPAYYRDRLGDYLAFAQTVLKPCGHLLLIVKNKLGVDVLCGKTNGAESPYEAFNAPDNDYYTCEEIGRELREAGYQKHKFFYPLPDAVLPQEIYSENYVPKGKRTDRMLNYFPQKKTLLMSPEGLLSDVISNEIFAKCTNSFLLDCSVEADPSSVSYVALSTDRERGAAYATKIYQGDYVDKTALFLEGAEGIRGLASNALELDARGIDTVPQELSVDGRTLRMPYVGEELLIKRIAELSDAQEALQSVFDVLYQAVLQSSEYVPEEKNTMRSYAPEADWGIILEKAYIDMIPLNCFWNDGKLLFFDQEFTFMNCPAKYVMFRALRYTFLSLNSEGKVFDLDSLCKRYGLEELWEIFLKEEDKFIYKNRNHELYGNFYNWTQLEEQCIADNVGRLLQREPEKLWTQEMHDDISWFFSDMFYGRESDDCGVWRWSCGTEAEIVLKGIGDTTEKYELEFELILPEPNHVKRAEIYIDNRRWGQVVVPNRVIIPLRLGKERQSKIVIRGDFTEKTFEGDSRRFFFQFRNYSIRKEPAYVSDLIKDVREVQVDILKNLQRVCSDYDLRHFAIYGTLLGIIRNEDYIPWDDDIDIAMPRKDYNQLLKLDREEHVFGKTLFLQNMYSDSKCFFGGYSKLRKNGTLGITKQNRGRECHNGIWIDIFPIDNRIQDIYKLCRQHKRIHFYQRLLFHKVYGRNGIYSKDNSWSWFCFWYSKIFKYNFLCSQLDRAIQKYNLEETAKQSVFARIMNLASIPAFPRECFSKNGVGHFHGIEVNIPIVAEECLNVIWGHHYMLYPSEEFRKPHEDVFYSLEAN